MTCRRQKSRINGDAVEKRMPANSSNHNFTHHKAVNNTSVCERRKIKEQTLQIGEKKLIQESSDLASTKASRQNVDEYHQSHFKLHEKLSRKKVMLYLKFYISRKQIGIFLNIMRERIYDDYALLYGFKLLHQYVIKGQRQKKKTIQYGALPFIKKVLKMHCIDKKNKNNELRRILCTIIISVGKEYGKDMIAYGILEDIIHILKSFVEYYQVNRKVSKTTRVENYYINIIRSISSILNLHDNSGNIAGAQTQSLNDAKPLNTMLNFIKQQEVVEVGSTVLIETLLLKCLKDGSILFQKNIRCIESTYVCMKYLCVYL